MTPQPIVPAYVHPALDPAFWRRLELGVGGGVVVVNASSGPGSSTDPEYQATVAPLLAAGVRVAGYVDLGYGQRAVADVLADAEHWHDGYGVRELFLDRAPADAGWVRTAHRILAALPGAPAVGRWPVRRRPLPSAVSVVLNHGTVPHPSYFELPAVIGTFEGPLAAYRECAALGWLRRLPAGRQAHLVHSLADLEEVDEVTVRARSLGAGLVGTGLAGGPHEWSAPTWPAPARREPAQA